MDHYLAEAPRPSLETDAQQALVSLSGSQTVRRELEQMVSEWTQQPKVYPLSLPYTRAVSRVN
jgi:hypothetical protein